MTDASTRRRHASAASADAAARAGAAHRPGVPPLDKHSPKPIAPSDASRSERETEPDRRLRRRELPREPLVSDVAALAAATAFARLASAPRERRGSRRWSAAARSTTSSATCCARCCRPGSTRTCRRSSSGWSRPRSPGSSVRRRAGASRLQRRAVVARLPLVSSGRMTRCRTYVRDDPFVTD